MSTCEYMNIWYLRVFTTQISMNTCYVRVFAFCTAVGASITADMPHLWDIRGGITATGTTELTLQANKHPYTTKTKCELANKYPNICTETAI